MFILDAKDYISNFLQGQLPNDPVIKQTDGLIFQLTDQTKLDFLNYPIKKFLEQLADEIKNETELGKKIKAKHKKVVPMYPRVILGKQFGSITCFMSLKGIVTTSSILIRVTAEIGYFKVWTHQNKDKVLIIPKTTPKEEMLSQILNYLLY